jgi:hypothetical protein
LVLTDSVLASPEDFTAAIISSYSGGDSRVEMNFPRFSLLGSIGLPTGFVSLIWSFLILVVAGYAARPATHLQTSVSPLRGPEPVRLKLNGNWQTAIKKSLQKKRPVAGWPK